MISAAGRGSSTTSSASEPPAPQRESNSRRRKRAAHHRCGRSQHHHSVMTSIPDHVGSDTEPLVACFDTALIRPRFLSGKPCA
jgi:hypothetical protein